MGRGGGGLYYREADKPGVSSAASIPNLPKTFFGWIPVLWRITDEQVLSSAGLDAYVVCTKIACATLPHGVSLVF